jgi:hypothetical protein
MFLGKSIYKQKNFFLQLHFYVIIDHFLSKRDYKLKMGNNSLELCLSKANLQLTLEVRLLHFCLYFLLTTISIFFNLLLIFLIRAEWSKLERGIYYLVVRIGHYQSGLKKICFQKNFYKLD